MKALNTFLTTCADYLDNRVLTGKLFGDIRYLLNNSGNFFYKAIKELFIAISHSRIFLLYMDVLLFFWLLLLKIPLAKVVIAMIADAIKMLIKYYSEIFIVFAFTFTSSILLLNFFQTSLPMFFITLIPILLLDVLFVSALYYCLDRDVARERVSLWQSLLIILRHFPSLSFPLITESAVFLETIIIFFITSLFVSYIFDFFQIPWSGSILFWFVIMISGSISIISIFTITILIHQTYFIVLLDHIPFQQALQRARRMVNASLSYYLFFYLLYSLFCVLFIWRAFFSYLYLGITVSLYCTITLGSFLGYMLRRKFPPPSSKYTVDLISNQKTYLFSIILIFFGCINYVLVSILFIKEQQPIFTFIQQQQDNFLAAQEVNLYTNTTYGYIIKYPKQWSIYQWEKNSVTFYNNYTGSLTGGTWMTITVSSYDTNTFTKLYDANPGIVTKNPQSKNIMTKVTNFTIQGYEAANYTYIKPGLPYAQYETHYLIHRNNSLYDIAFISMTNDVANYNSDLFQSIINSLRFTTTLKE